MSRPGAKRDHDKFCRTEDWLLVRDSQGQPVRHHVTYELPLADGRVLRTRISRPVDNTTYGAETWSSILGSQQLDVTEDAFWDCVRDGVKPPRPSETVVVPAKALPADLVYNLLTRLHMSEADVALLTKQEAIDRMAEFWSAQD